MDTLAVRLTVPTAKSVADFHRQVIAHAGRTNKKDDQFLPVVLFYLLHDTADHTRRICMETLSGVRACERFGQLPVYKYSHFILAGGHRRYRYFNNGRLILQIICNKRNFKSIAIVVS